MNLQLHDGRFRNSLVATIPVNSDQEAERLLLSSSVALEGIIHMALHDADGLRASWVVVTDGRLLMTLRSTRYEGTWTVGRLSTEMNAVQWPLPAHCG